MWRLVAVALLAAACSRGQPGDQAAAALAADARDEVVATVDGRPIYAAAVALQAHARGVDRKTALADLVDAELLAGEASRRGLERDLEVRDETKGALVRRYLKLGFEPTLSPADVPDQVVRRDYVKKRAYLDHNTYADVWHFFVPVAANATAADKAKAQARAESLARRARGLTLAQFKQLGVDEGLHGEEVVTARDGWVQRPFSEAAFTQLSKPGDTTHGLVETSFGYHVLYLIRWIPPVHVSLAEAAPKIRESEFPELQKHAFQKLLDDAMSRYKIELHPERLPQ
jgi:hypothetical protein